ncbi:MAG TPA: NUDIX hydrolase [Thermoanaerobaculia bacterium]|nr:NUDIX hydrolase [Thermoanaerobaculia bacterium]
MERTRIPSGETGEFVILRAKPWVNVVAVTSAGNLVLVRHFRHGISDYSLELPAGIIENDETVSAAAVRELLEETGYEGTDGRLLGELYPNPGLQDNACFSWLVRNAASVRVAQPDPLEDVEVVEMPFTAVRTAVMRGEIRNALTVAALYLALDDLR